MIDIMSMAEDIEDLEALHDLCNLMQTICTLPSSFHAMTLIWISSNAK